MLRIVFGVGEQQLAHVTSRPVTSATFELEDLTESLEGELRVLAEGAATVDTTELETASTAGRRSADPAWLPVDDTTGAAVGPWWVEADGLGELVQVEAVRAGEGLSLRSPMLRDYPTGAILVPLTITAACPALVADDDDYLDTPLRVVWRYEIDGRPQVAQEQVRVTRQIRTDAAMPEVLEMIGDFAPDIPPRLRPGELERWARLASRLVHSRARSLQIDPARLLAGDSMVELLCWATLEVVAENGYAPGRHDLDTFARDVRRRYAAVWDSLTIGLPGRETVETNDDGERVASTGRSGLSFSW
jgi:hypothetical protein